jgi:hypothetical protein
VNGDRLAIGLDSGNVIYVEVEDRSIRNEFELTEASYTQRLYSFFARYDCIYFCME